MSVSRFLSGVWLIAAPLLFATDPDKTWAITLDENPAQVVKLLGTPAQTGEAAPGHFSWYLQLDHGDNHDYSHVLLFRQSDRKLVSLTRNYHEPTLVDSLFPTADTKTYYWQKGTQPRWPVRVRFLKDGQSALVAMGVEKAGEKTDQVLLIRRSALVSYLPWLAEQLADR